MRIPSKPLFLTSVALSFFLNSSAAEAESPEFWREEGRATILKAAEMKPIKKRAKNVILFVGDGMGISTVTAARIFQGQLNGESGEENWLEFEKLPYTALSKTYNTNLQTPDSAGTMSAIMTGVKTSAGVLSVNQYAKRGDAASSVGNELFTILEKAEIAGKATGIVTTAKITHATPAACYAHVSERGWESDADLPENSGIKDIAAQLIDMPEFWNQKGFPMVDGLEVAFGGGRGNFLPKGAIDSAYSSEGDEGSRLDGRDLIGEWLTTRSNATYVHDLDTFNAIDPEKVDHAFGLFERSHMQYETDRTNEPSLSEMTGKAIDILSKRKKGFFLMVEGGRIDHAHHAGNAYRALMDTVALSDAVKTARERTNERDTLIIVTADHSHVFTMAGYAARGNSIVGLSADAQGRLAKDAMGMPYTTLGYQNGPGYTGASDKQAEGLKTYPHSPDAYKGVTQGRPDMTETFGTNLGELDCDDFVDHLQESAYPMGSETHGGEDVGIWASGPYAHLLRGTIEQNVIFHLMDYAFGLKVKDPFEE